MSITRITTWIVSFAAHAAIVVPLVLSDEGGPPAALEFGTGNDQLLLEQGISLVGFTSSGAAMETVEAVDAPPPQAATPPAIEAVEQLEEQPEITDVISADAEPVEDSIVPEEVPEEIEEIKPQEVALAQPVTQIARDEQVAAGAKKKGGDATKRSAYLGKIRSHIDRKKINPKSRSAGTAVVKFSVGPEGNILSREVTKSSGSSKLDKAAIASIDRAAPFPPFPNGVGKEIMVVSVPFRFSVR